MATNLSENPFGVIDAPNPCDGEVIAFARNAPLDGATDDANAGIWSVAEPVPHTSIEGRWESRWNGAADPTIAGDTADTWKQGTGELKIVQDRIY